MNKKGILSIFLAVMTAFILIYAFIVLGNIGTINERFVGAHAVKLGELYKIGENVRFYIDSSGLYAKDIALFEFEKNGQFPRCGEMETYFLWKNQSHECYPTKDSISFGMRTAFASVINPFLENYKLYDVTPDMLTPADLIFEDGVLKGYPFDSLVINKDPLYSISQGFSVNFEYPFDYNDLKKYLLEINEKCKDQETSALKNCVQAEVNRINLLESGKSREWKFGGCDDSDENLLNAFAEKYNDCAASYDIDCDCPILQYDLRINIQGEVAVLGNYSSLLGLPFNPPAMIPGARLIKKKNFIDLASSGVSNPVCRSDRRMFKLCVKQPFRVNIFGEQKQLMTRFAIYIDDEAAPEPISVSRTGKGFEWDASTSPDVKEYRVFAYKKGLVPDYSSFDVVGRAKNSQEKLSMLKDPSMYDLEVVAVDHNKNCIISGRKEKCD
ncbi:hypothetical protein KY326_03650 [Candidatus Woesearchaeota archaeon]|nr:hypothetical protein [Candidatus Woesearchaeota archaeon]